MANTCWEISAPSQDVFTLRKAIAERRDEVISTSDVNAASVAKLNSDAMEQAKVCPIKMKSPFYSSLPNESDAREYAYRRET